MDKKFILYGYSSPTDGTWRIDETLFSTGVDYRTKSRYKEYFDCGLNLLMLQGNDPYTGEKWESSQTKKNMDNAYAAGIKKIIIYDKRIFDLSEKSGGIIGKDKDFVDEGQLEEFIAFCIRDYSKHPAFYGFMLVDEPRWFQIEALSQIMRAAKKVAPNIFVQCNLLPLYSCNNALYMEKGANQDLCDGFENYIRTYLERSGSDYLLYDSYPMRLEPEKGMFILWHHLTGLQIAADVCREKGVKFYFVCQATALYIDGKIRFRSCGEDDMRWQLNCVLAFGVKSVAYYTYWHKQQNGFEFGIHTDGTAFITSDGVRTALYAVMKKLHGEMQVLAPYLLECEYEDSGYRTSFFKTPEALSGMERRKFDGIRSLEMEENTAVVITRLRHKPGGETVYCLFNANDPEGEFSGEKKIRVNFAGKLIKTFSLKKPGGIDISESEFTLKAGDSAFFEVKE